MSKAEILAEIPKLTPEEREEIYLKIVELDSDEWLDTDDPLTDEQKALIEARIEAHEKNPQSAIPWEEFNARPQAEIRRVKFRLVVHPEVDARTARISST
jgi:putative addiction module component (TIGR02574 family)